MVWPEGEIRDQKDELPNHFNKMPIDRLEEPRIQKELFAFNAWH
jgi:hypothetical protein